jgi:hypothetical protein
MIDALLRELSTRAVENLDTQSATAVRTLLRDKPQGLRNLDRRTHDPDGERNDGREANELMRSTDARDRSRGLAKAMYLIRCNLVHGSKHFVEERSLVEAVTPSMGLYLDAGIDLLDSWVRGQNGTSSSSSS